MARLGNSESEVIEWVGGQGGRAADGWTWHARHRMTGEAIENVDSTLPETNLRRGGHVVIVLD